MRTFLFSTFLCFASVILMAAQNSNTIPQSQDANAQDSDHLGKVRGCLSRSGDVYAVLGGNPVRQYRVIGGDLAALKGKQGHTVEITGPVKAKPSGASPNGNYTPGSTTGVGYDMIRAETVKDIAPTCS